MHISAYRQCKHPLQNAGGVCAVCLKDRLSKVNGSHKAGARCSDAERQPSKIAVSLLHCHADPVAVMNYEVTSPSEEIAEARQSIACLIDRDISKANGRFSDATSQGSHTRPDSVQFLRSKSASQLDAYARLDGKPIVDNQEPQNGRMNLKIKHLKEGMSSSAVTSQSKSGMALLPPYYKNNGELSKSKSTGWALNHQLMSDISRWSELHSPVNLLGWNKKQKTSCSSNASLEQPTVPLMFPRCRVNHGCSSDVKTKNKIWKPLRVLLHWRRKPTKPSLNSSTDSSSTSWSTSSSSSSSYLSSLEGKRQLNITAPKLSGHGKLEHMICGHRLGRMLSQVMDRSTLKDANAIDSLDKGRVNDRSLKQATFCVSETVSGSDNVCHHVDSLLQQNSSLLDVAQSREMTGSGTPSVQGHGVAASARGSGTDELDTCSRKVSVADALMVPLSVSMSPRENFESVASSSLASASPPAATYLDTTFAYSIANVKLDHKCTLSIAALMAIDGKNTVPLKMAC